MSKAPMLWTELKLKTPAELQEPLVNRLFELGAEGVSELGGDAVIGLSAYFPKASITEVLAQMPEYTNSLSELFPHLARVTWESLDVVPENWSETYKEFYKAQKLSPRFFLRPAWDKKTEIPSGMMAIIMEPGQAFGTGLHPTTRLTLEQLEIVVQSHPDVAGSTLLDVGTGTGILAMAACKLGIGRVVAIDNDPLAVDAALENAIMNDCKSMEVSGADLATFTGTFSIILSNILLVTHGELAGHYKRLLAPQGKLILSGVLGEQRQSLKSLMNAEGLVEQSWQASEEWVAVSFTH